MGLDVGTKTVGVAVADELGFTAQPITVVRRSNLKADLAELIRLAADRSVDRFVIGLPLNMDGSEGPRALATRKFGDALAKKPGWQLVTYLDHRDPADPERARASAANDRAIARLLAAVRPGDLLFVDHPGPPGDDGGHTRVCTRAARTSDADRAPTFAQARFDQAREEADGLAELAGGREVQFWHLRPLL